MNNNEIMNNEVVEATEEVIENAGLSKGVKIAAGIGLSVVVGVVVYKYVAKPVIANIKAQIEQKKMAVALSLTPLSRDIILLVITERLVWQVPLALLPKKVYMTHLIARCAAVR